MELTKLPLEVCEGFLRMIVPLLRTRSDIDVQACFKTTRGAWRDLRLRVYPQGTKPATPVRQTSMQRTPGSGLVTASAQSLRAIDDYSSRQTRSYSTADALVSSASTKSRGGGSATTGGVSAMDSHFQSGRGHRSQRSQSFSADRMASAGNPFEADATNPYHARTTRQGGNQTGRGSTPRKLDLNRINSRLSRLRQRDT